MWLDSIEDSTDIKQIYGRDPILNDIVLYNLSIDYANNSVGLDIDFFDWPVPLPKDWYIDQYTCLSLKVNFKDVFFNNVNLGKECIKYNINIESTEENSIRIRISDNEGYCFYDFIAKSAKVVNFTFWDHRND